MNRLLAVVDTNYSRGFNYDEFGNMSVSEDGTIAVKSGLAPQSGGGLPNPYDPGTNRLLSAGYDARGDMTKLGTTTMTYDAEGNQISTADSGVGGQSVSYAFDAEGQRVVKQVAGGATVFDIHDAFGRLAVEYSSASLTAACNTCYLMYDGVGSVRLITNENGGLVARHDYLPYGEEIADGTAGRSGKFAFSSNVRQGFTGQEADGGTPVLDYFNARHMSAVLGSFTQPDPMQAGADFLNPQSWNGYAYVLGNPLGLVDPSGMSSNYSGIQDGSCPASQATCPRPGTPVVGSPTVPSEIDGAEANYVKQVVVAGYIASIGVTYPNLVQFFPAPGGTGWSIYYGEAEIAKMSADLSGQLGGEFAGALSLVGQNVDAQYSFLGKFAGLSVAAGTAVAAALPAASVSTPSMLAGQTPVIGGLDFTSTYAAKLGYSVFSQPSAAYTWGLNAAWLGSQVATGQSFLVGMGGYWTAQEVAYLVGRSYTQVGPFLVPPLP